VRLAWLNTNFGSHRNTKKFFEEMSDAAYLCHGAVNCAFGAFPAYQLRLLGLRSIYFSKSGESLAIVRFTPTCRSLAMPVTLLFCLQVAPFQDNILW
jgi:hypothetical protein